MLRLSVTLTLLLLIGCALARPPRGGSSGRRDEGREAGRQQDGRRGAGPPRGDLVIRDSSSSSDDDGSSAEDDGESSKSADDVTIEGPDIEEEVPESAVPAELRRLFQEEARDGGRREGRRGKHGKGRKGKGEQLMKLACSITNVTSGDLIATRDCPDNITCSLGSLIVPACDSTFLQLTFCDGLPSFGDNDDDEMMADEDEDISREEDSDSDEDEDEDEDEKSSKSHRGRGLAGAACSLQGEGVDIIRPCRGNNTCDLGPAIPLQLNGTSVSALFCQPPAGTEERPCRDEDEDRSEEESMGGRGRGGRGGPGSRRGNSERGERPSVDTDAPAAPAAGTRRQGRREGRGPRND